MCMHVSAFSGYYLCHPVPVNKYKLADRKLLAGYTISSANTGPILSYAEIARVGGNHAVQGHSKSRPILVTMESPCTTSYTVRQKKTLHHFIFAITFSGLIYKCTYTALKCVMHNTENRKKVSMYQHRYTHFLHFRIQLLRFVFRAQTPTGLCLSVPLGTFVSHHPFGPVTEFLKMPSLVMIQSTLGTPTAAMTERVGVALFGVGNIGTIHLINLLHNEHAIVYYVDELDVAKARDVVHKYRMTETVVHSADDASQLYEDY